MTPTQRLREEWLVILVDKVVISLIVAGFAVYLSHVVQDAEKHTEHVRHATDSLQKHLEDVRKVITTELDQFEEALLAATTADEINVDSMRTSKARIERAYDQRLGPNAFASGQDLPQLRRARTAVESLLAVCGQAIAEAQISRKTDPHRPDTLTKTYEILVGKTHPSTMAELNLMIAEAANNNL